jgi:anion-transporting  ArsA/GET3 family ATPase
MTALGSRMPPLAAALAERKVVLCVGSGGVGKTTTAAALAVEAARRGRRTVVLTVDPAERLKDALGLGALAGEPHRVPLDALAPAAHLDALLLDVKRTLDELVLGLSATAAEAERILANRLYQNLASALSGTAEYMAVESVYRLAAESDYDLVVVDTPPARHAIDFLDAPRRLLALLDSRAFAILKNPTSILPAAGSRLAQMVLSAILSGLERFTGIGLVREIGEFIGAIEAVTGGLKERLAATAALLRGSETALFLVTAPEPRLADESAALARALAATGLGIEGMIVNRALPMAVFGPGAAYPAPIDGVSPRLAARLARSWDELRALGARQAAAMEPLVAAAGAPILAEVPLLATDPGSLADLLTIAGHLVPAVGEQSRSRLG